jgi:hypothetical protein
MVGNHPTSGVVLWSAISVISARRTAIILCIWRSFSAGGRVRGARLATCVHGFACRHTGSRRRSSSW